MNLFNTCIKGKAVTVTGIVAASVMLFTGCMSFNPRSVRSLEAALIESNPNLDIESSTKFGIGALTMDFVDFAFVHDRSVDLSKISRADIAIYELRTPLAFNDFTMPQEVTADRACPRREVIMRVREEDEYMQLVVCIRNDKVTGLAMFMLEPREIVVVNARGNFEAIVSSMVKANVKKRSSEAEGQAGADQERSPTIANSGASIQRPPS
jgi:hypothetical protein